MSLDVNTIATDADLAQEIGGADRLHSTQKDIAVRNGYRASALVDVLRALDTRSPPVRDSDLVDPSELKMAVVYRALAKVCQSAITSDGDKHHVLARNYEREFAGAVQQRFTVAPGVSSPSGGTFSWERR